MKGDGTKKEIVILNDSDIVDEYTYPHVEFETNDGSISIINLTDDPARDFKFDGLEPQKTYSVDNELKIISGDGRNLLSKFSKKWLRLRRGSNRLAVTVNGTVTITCPQYVKISF